MRPAKSIIVSFKWFSSVLSNTALHEKGQTLHLANINSKHLANPQWRAFRSHHCLYKLVAEKQKDCHIIAAWKLLSSIASYFSWHSYKVYSIGWRCRTRFLKAWILFSALLDFLCVKPIDKDNADKKPHSNSHIKTLFLGLSNLPLLDRKNGKPKSIKKKKKDMSLDSV